MTRIFNADLGRTLASLVAALLISTTFVAAAVASAHVTPAARTTTLTA